MEVKNVTNNEDIVLYPVGMICNLIDRDHNEYGTMCTIRFIELDEEGIYYYYLLANDERKNIYFDNRFGPYFSFVESTNPYLLPLANPTMM